MSLLFQPGADRHVDLLSVGDPNLDLVFAIDEVPLADQKCLGRHLGAFAGGTTANVACAAARLGARTQVFGRIGDDPQGQFLKAEFERFSVSTEHLRVCRGAASATAIVMINGRGEKAVIYVPMMERDGSDSLPAELLARSRVIYAMPYEIAAFSTMARSAHEYGADVVIDIEPAMVPDGSRLDALLSLSDIVLLSESSFREILGVQPSGEALQRLLLQGPRAIIVTLGAEGALAATRRELVRQPAFAASVVDSTGAGDCFAGALLAAALEGESLAHAMRFAAAAASISVTGIGARSMLPDRAAVAAVIRRQPRAP